MGLNTLEKILMKNGKSYLDDLLSKELIITEKIDTHRMIFEKKDDNLIFYKKDNSEIDIIDRTLSDMYEDAILEIDTLISDTKLPNDFRFGIYYTPSEKTLKIPYINLPRYILTDISIVKNDKIVESLDYDEIDKWASMLCMARSPIIFKGFLNENQKTMLFNYGSKQFNDNTLSFSSMICELFGSTYSNQDVIEGIVIKTEDKLLQILSYEFEMLNETYDKNVQNRDFYDIIILSINSFLESYNLPILESNIPEQSYINIISDIFNKYVELNDICEKLEINYLTPPKFGYMGKLNKRFITNAKTLEYLSGSDIFESLFKVILSSFRKYKKPYGLLDESVIERFNTYVYIINNHANIYNYKDIESDILYESISNNMIVNEIKKKVPTDIDNMRVIASIQRAFNSEPKKISKGEQQCVVYLTSFDPFTNVQMENISNIVKTWKVHIILAAISNKYKLKGKNISFSDDLIKAQMKSLIDFNDDIKSFILLDSWDLVEIFEYCRPKYEPITIITDIGKKSEIALQLYFEDGVMGGRVDVNKEFNIGEMENIDKLPAFRSIEDNNASLFMSLTPKGINNLFNNFVSEYKTQSGEIKKN